MGDGGIGGDDRIAEDQKIRTAPSAIDGIRGVRLSVVEVCRGGRRQMATCGSPADPDPVRQYIELLRAASDDADSRLSVAELARIVVSQSKAILQHERSHAHRV